MGDRTIERDAVRVLFILHFCGEEHRQLSMFDSYAYTHTIGSESKLQKLDFWLRYPDYLAAALLEGCQAGGPLIDRSDEIKQVIRRIFQEQEPALRWIPMRKYLWGAYEPLDAVMTFLSSRVLASRRVTEDGHRIQYYLTPKGHDAVNGILTDCPESAWYADRCRLIASFFGHLVGLDLRKIQYREETYVAARTRATIERIEAEIAERFNFIFGEPLC